MKKAHLLLILIVILGAFLRFYNLSWGDSYFFHPDENNMASSISQLSLNNKLNPNFFAYGQFPLYLVYFTSQIINLFDSLRMFFEFRISNFEFPVAVPFSSAIFLLRFYSAIASTLTILLVYLIANSLARRPLANLTAAFAAFTPGLIQAAHFGTTESLLTFLFMLILYLSLRLFEKGKKAISSDLVLLGIVCGTALASKLTAVYFLPTAFLAILVNLINQKARFSIYVKQILLFTICCLLFAVLFSPYNVLSFNNFYGALNYETAVATGEAKVFYTRQFEQTTPFLFQMQKIFPYALGFPLFIFGILGFWISLGQLVIRLIRNLLTLTDKKTALVLFSFLIYFLPNALLFAKWTRFMTPIFPFFAIFTSYLLSQYQISNIKDQNYSSKLKNFKFLFVVLIFALCTLSLLYGLNFFSIYTRPDSRIQASNWIYQNIPENSYVLSETANVVDIPIQIQNSNLPDGKAGFKIQNYTVISFDFYHLDENPTLADNLIGHLEKADFVFIPSRRLFANHLRLPDKYPILNRYYQALFNGKLGFEKVAEFSSFPNLEFGIWNLEFDDERSEETFTVFDHPVIRVYKKTKGLTRPEYENILRGN